MNATETSPKRVTLPISSGDVSAALLARRILDLSVKAAARPKRKAKLLTLMGRHDRLRNTCYKIYHSKIQQVISWAEAEVLHNIHSNTQGEVKAAEPKVAKVNLNFSLEGFTKRFDTAMSEAAEDSFSVVSRGLSSELGEGEEVTPQGVIKKFLNERENKVSGCPQEIYDTINRELEAGTNTGDTMDELADRIQQKFEGISKGRAMVIAQTETQSVYGTAQARAIKQAGFEKKRWVTYHDEKVRPSHEACEAEGAIPVDQEFTNGCMFPGDPDGEAEEVIGCRCYLVADEGEGDEFEDSGFES